MMYRAIAISAVCIGLFGQEQTTHQENSSSSGDLAFLLLVNQITPGENLSTTNSRSGAGLLIGFEGKVGRLVMEGAWFPVQSRVVAGESRRITVVTCGFGYDHKIPIVSGGNNSIYALGGIHLDWWTSGSDGEKYPDNSSGNLGFRAGVGMRLNKLVGEARYRFTFGDVRVHSSDSGSAAAWSAYELSFGFRF